MSEQIINTKTGVYGRVNIALPLPAKLSMLSWQKKTGMNKAQFLRTALMMGALMSTVLTVVVIPLAYYLYALARGQGK